MREREEIQELLRAQGVIA
ncbi:MAG: hypothetical protein M3Y86_05830 [Verrucomicrobiota bacterium]|nr:hypothetical protein [Verrucomicrobiota bacterium]